MLHPRPRGGLVPLARAVVLLTLASSCAGEEKPRPRSAAAAAAEASEDATASAPLTMEGGAASFNGRPSSQPDSALGPGAEAAMAAEDWPRAEEIYRELARRQPRNMDARRGLGAALSHQDRHDQAIAVLQEALESEDSPSTRLALGRTLAAAGKNGTALPHFRKAALGLQTDPDAWAGLLESLAANDKAQSAAETVRDAKKSCPKCSKHPGFRRAVAAVAEAQGRDALKLVEAGDTAGAARAADAALALDPEQPEAELARARIAQASGDSSGSEKAYRRAIEKLPDGAGEVAADARLELAALLTSSGQSAEAVTFARQAAAARPQHGRSIEVLGRACDAARDVPCARAAYAKLVGMGEAGGVSADATAYAARRLKVLKGGRGGKRAGKAAKRKR